MFKKLKIIEKILNKSIPKGRNPKLLNHIKKKKKG